MRMNWRRRVLTAVLIVIVSGGAVSAQDRTIEPVTDALLQDPDPADWLNWRRTLDGWGYSPLDQITRDNVGEMRLAWSWALHPGVSQTTPLVYDGVMYIANPGGVMQAVDAVTGDLLWEHRRDFTSEVARSGQMRSLAIYHDLILMNTADAHTVALDARTGDVRWDVEVGNHELGNRFTSGPLVANGTIVVSLVGCQRYVDEACYIVGLEAETGRELWRTSTVALPGERGGDTWGDLPLTFRAGGDAWIPGSYDPATNLIYWGTAQAKPWARAQRGIDGDALYTNSTLALDPATGEMRWYYQHIPGESHDMDETFERILIDYDGRRSVFTMGKLGILWELDRETGRFISAHDLGYQNLIDVDPASGQVTYRPGQLQELGEEIFFCPSTSGFKSLRAMAYHPDTEAFYIPLNLNCETGAFGPVERVVGGGGEGPVRRTNHFHPKNPDQLGEFVAMDMRTGEVLWRHRRRTPFHTAALTTAGGLVFAGDWDRYMFAFDIRSGAVLWRTRLPLMTNGYPITYAVDGKQYVAVSAAVPFGGASWSTLLPADLTPEKRNPSAGNALFVFALHE